MAKCDVSPANLYERSLWRFGPNWFHETEDCWPTLHKEETDIPEKRNTPLLSVYSSEENELFKRFSSLYRMQRVIVCN